MSLKSLQGSQPTASGGRHPKQLNPVKVWMETVEVGHGQLLSFAMTSVPEVVLRLERISSVRPP